VQCDEEDKEITMRLLSKNSVASTSATPILVGWSHKRYWLGWVYTRYSSAGWFDTLPKRLLHLRLINLTKLWGGANPHHAMKPQTRKK
jgi:hypothetical protein